MQPSESSYSAPVFLARPDITQRQALQLATQHQCREALWLGRRGDGLGWIGQKQRPCQLNGAQMRAAWQAMEPILLAGFASDAIAQQQRAITAARALYDHVLEHHECSELLQQPPYQSRLAPHFDMLACSQNEADHQEIVTLEFDVVEANTIVAEDLWVKVSWLSYAEEDLSLRFRFSFGLVGYENVAADYARQLYAGQLSEALFPEASILSANCALDNLLCELLSVDKVAYVERIVYFNAPDGGAQFHQDVERGHLGVVYAQLSGRTAWLALSKQSLVAEISHFLKTPAAAQELDEVIPSSQEQRLLMTQADNDEELAKLLDDSEHNDALEALINRLPSFTRQLVESGHGFILAPGDLILLPQQDCDRCAWHAVFCLDEEPGQALSFAVRAAP